MSWTLQGNYGHGWEDLTTEQTRDEIRARYDEYVVNEGGSYRIVPEREN